MRQVWKFAVQAQDYFQVEMPMGAEILAVQTQDGTPQLWALADPGRPRVSRRFRVAGTGHPIEDDALEYVGTFQVHGGLLVFHVFEVRR